MVNNKSFLTLIIGGLLVVFLMSLIIIRAVSSDIILNIFFIPGLIAGITRSKPWWTCGFLGFFLGAVSAVGIEILLTRFNDLFITSLFTHQDWLVQSSYLMVFPALNALVGLHFSVAINRENPFRSIADPNLESLRQSIGGTLVASILLASVIILYINIYLNRGGSFPVSSLSVLFLSSFLIGLISVLLLNCTLNNAFKVGVIAPLVVNSILLLLDLFSRLPLEADNQFGYGLRALFLILMIIVTLSAVLSGTLFGGLLIRIMRNNK